MLYVDWMDQLDPILKALEAPFDAVYEFEMRIEEVWFIIPFWTFPYGQWVDEQTGSYLER